jgi:aminoglycoside 3-N-acetyltransferase
MTDELAPRQGLRAAVGRDRLVEDLRSLGLRRGQDLLIHSSLRQIGRIDGGAATLLTAICDVAGPDATLVVPTQTPLRSVTAAMPGFDPASTPSTGMGTFAEYLRTRPSAVRSSHPWVSFAALGPGARACMSVHDLDCHLGDRSPLGWLYAADAAILLLGVGYSVCTAFHLAEYHLPGLAPSRRYRYVTASGQILVEREFTDIELDDSDFGLLGSHVESAADLGALPGLRRGQVGSAACRLLPLRTSVDFARTWLAVHRGR